MSDSLGENGTETIVRKTPWRYRVYLLQRIMFSGHVYFVKNRFKVTVHTHAYSYKMYTFCRGGGGDKMGRHIKRYASISRVACVVTRLKHWVFCRWLGNRTFLITPKTNGKAITGSGSRTNHLENYCVFLGGSIFVCLESRHCQKTAWNRSVLVFIPENYHFPRPTLYPACVVRTDGTRRFNHTGSHSRII